MFSGCTYKSEPEKMKGEKAQAIRLLAKSKLRNGEFFLTVDGFDDALKYYETNGDSSALLDMYQLAAVKMRWLCKQDSAALFLNKAIEIASETTDPTMFELYTELSNTYAIPSLKKDYEKAIFYAKSALNVSQTREERSRALHDIGLFFSFIGRNDSASVYMERALNETDRNDPLFTTYVLNYANNPSSDFKRSIAHLNKLKTQNLGVLITLGFIYINHSQLDSAKYYMKVSKDLYNESPMHYSVNTYNNLRLLEQSLKLLETGNVEPYDGTVTNDSISEVKAIQRKISDEQRDYGNMLKLQLTESNIHRQILLNIGLGILLVIALGFGGYVWYSKRKFISLKSRLDNLKIDQIVADAIGDEPTAFSDLVQRRMDICREQFRDMKLQADLDKMAIIYRTTGNYPNIKEREMIQKKLIGCFADFIVDLKFTGVRLNMEDILTCLLSCLKESNVTIAACLGSTDVAVRTRKSRLRAKLPGEMIDLLGL